MAVSKSTDKSTVKQVADILVEELGPIKAIAIVERLIAASDGNESFRSSIMTLKIYLEARYQ